MFDSVTKPKIDLPEYSSSNNTMTLRDQFAINCPHELVDTYFKLYMRYETLTQEEYLTAMCVIRYRYADAMLAEREKK